MQMTIHFVAGRSNSLQTEIESHIPPHLSSLHVASGFFSDKGAKLLEDLILSNSSTLEEIYIVIGWSTLGGLKGLARIKDRVSLLPSRRVSLNIALDLGKRRRGKSRIFNQMHSKMLAASSSLEVFGVVGSSNYTINGLDDQANEEANLLVKVKTLDSTSSLITEISNEVERLAGIATDFDTRKIMTYAQHYNYLAKNFRFFPESKGSVKEEEYQRDLVSLSGFLELNQRGGSPAFKEGERIFFEKSNEIKNPEAKILIRLWYRGHPTDKCLVVKVENSQTTDNTITDGCDWRSDVSRNFIEKILPTTTLTGTAGYYCYSGIIEKITSIYSVYWCDRREEPELQEGDETIHVRLRNPEHGSENFPEEGSQVIDIIRMNANLETLAKILDDTTIRPQIDQGMVYLFDRDEEVEVEVGISTTWEESAEYSHELKKYVIMC